MRLDRAWIEAHIPHHGEMCLLDEVSSWDEHRIVCRTSTHHHSAHPMRSGARLGIACGVEYAAQAMAIHGALLGDARRYAGEAGKAGAAGVLGVPGDATATRVVGASGDAGVPGAPAHGFLASVRNVRMRVLRLDDIAGELICVASKIAGDRRSGLYDFELRSETMLLLSGRAAVVLDSTPALR